MSVGNSNHYHAHEIQVRHYYQTAKKAGVPDSMVETALGQIVDDLPAAIENASAALPKNFPTELRDSIAEGSTQALRGDYGSSCLVQCFKYCINFAWFSAA